jgi:DNA-binding transcriptional ArsR family regulator
VSGTPEPRFARVAAMIGDATRARMLALLLGNAHATAGEIARCAGITPQTASAHLAKLVAAELITVRQQGRHRFFRLASDEVAHALEALAVVAERHALDGRAALWARDAWRPLRDARTCYKHLAGRLGVALHDGLLARRYLTLEAEAYRLTADGRAMLRTLGLDAARFERGRREPVYPCLDWSERRDHFAGPLAVALLEHFLARRWLRPVSGSRALCATAAGARALQELLGEPLSAAAGAQGAGAAQRAATQ